MYEDATTEACTLACKYGLYVGRRVPCAFTCGGSKTSDWEEELGVHGLCELPSLVVDICEMGPRFFCVLCA